MPKLDLTNRELEYLKNLMFCNKVDGHSYHSKKMKECELLDNDSKKQLLNELEGNLYDKIENAEFEGFKG
jgi:hypothetical protein